MSTEEPALALAQAPYPLAMIVCDGCWKDPYTGKFTLLGTFSFIGGTEFPLVHPVLTTYVALTDGRGKVPVRLQLIDVDEVREPIFEIKAEMNFSDPRMIIEIAFPVKNVVFPKPGEYRLKLFAGDEFIIERRILVSPPPKQDEDNDRDTAGQN